MQQGNQVATKITASWKNLDESRHNRPVIVLYLHSSDDLYGADIVLLQIVSGLDRTRFTPVVILPSDMKHVGLLSAKLSALGIEWTHLPLAIVRRRYLRPSGILLFLLNLVRGTWALRRLALQRHVRLIHGFTLAVAAAPFAAIFLPCPLIMHAHEILLRPKWLRKLLHLLSVRWSSRVICVSEATRRNIVEDRCSASNRICVLRNGVDPPVTSPRAIAELRAELGVPMDTKLVGMIARVSPWKGQEVFLEAAAIVRTKNPDCHFVAIGGVFDKEFQHLDRILRLHKRLHLNDCVTLCGFMPNARDMLPAFDLFISPSTSPDPFPTVILEAMRTGVPVIASAHGGPLEMIEDGVTGVLVPPGDSHALAGAIDALLLDPHRRHQIGEAGQILVQETFALAAFLNKLQGLYTEVLAGHSPVVGKRS
jgi:glycosyltransferase involved in cell wall biosynthesis